MKITIPKLKTEDLLFYLAYGIFLVSGILSTSFYYQYFSSIYSFIKYACVAILVFRELWMHKYNIRSLVIGGLFIVLIVITRTQSSVATIAYIFIFIFCARNVDFHGIIRFSAWVSLITVVFIIASMYLGIIQNYIHVNTMRTRQYLGFRYSTYCPHFLFNITGLFIYSKKEKISWLSLIALTGFNCWVYFMTRSRLSFVLSLVLILIAGFLKVRPRFFEHKRFLCMLMVSSFILCFGISMYFTVTYDSSVTWQKELNKVLENRLSLGQSALETYGISLFGQDIEMVGNGLDEFGEKNTSIAYNYVDSFYEQILLRYGIIFAAIWIGLLTYTLYYFYKQGDYWLLVWLTVKAGHCIVASVINLYYCSIWFAISVALFHFNKNREIKNSTQEKTK